VKISNVWEVGEKVSYYQSEMDGTYTLNYSHIDRILEDGTICLNDKRRFNKNGQSFDVFLGHKLMKESLPIKQKVGRLKEFFLKKVKNSLFVSNIKKRA